MPSVYVQHQTPNTLEIPEQPIPQNSNQTSAKANPQLQSPEQYWYRWIISLVSPLVEARNHNQSPVKKKEKHYVEHQVPFGRHNSLP
jgi:hypothetical protein